MLNVMLPPNRNARGELRLNLLILSAKSDIFFLIEHFNRLKCGRAFYYQNRCAMQRK